MLLNHFLNSFNFIKTVLFLVLTLYAAIMHKSIKLYLLLSILPSKEYLLQSSGLYTCFVTVLVFHELEKPVIFSIDFLHVCHISAIIRVVLLEQILVLFP